MIFKLLINQISEFYENTVEFNSATQNWHGYDIVGEINEPIPSILMKLFKHESITDDEIDSFKRALDKIDNQETFSALQSILIDIAIELSKKISTSVDGVLSKVEHDSITNSMVVFDLINALKSSAVKKIPFYLKFTPSGFSQKAQDGFSEKFSFDLENFELKCSALIERETKRDGDKDLYRSLPKGKAPQDHRVKSKNAQEFIVYGRNRKISKGKVGDTAFKTYRTTNQKEYFYFPSRNQQSVFTSKILTFISKKYFSSEHFASLGGIFSTKHPGYVCSLGPLETRQRLAEILKSDDGYVDGLGMIDEACQFVSEKDSTNLENIGLSNDESPYLTKIDHDRCEPFNTERVIFSPTFERRELTPTEEFHPLTSALMKQMRIEGLEERISHQEKFIMEKNFCRIKISFLSDVLIDYLFDQFYSNNPSDESSLEDDKKSLIKNCNAWVEHVNKNKSQIKNFDVLVYLAYLEAVKYARGHKVDDENKILCSLEDKYKELSGNKKIPTFNIETKNLSVSEMVDHFILKRKKDFLIELKSIIEDTIWKVGLLGGVKAQMSCNLVTLPNHVAMIYVMIVEGEKNEKNHNPNWNDVYEKVTKVNKEAASMKSSFLGINLRDKTAQDFYNETSEKLDHSPTKFGSSH